MSKVRNSETVLAVYPCARGLGFVVTRGPLSPTDWGTRRTDGKHKNAKCLEKVSKLIDIHQPDAIVMEDPTAEGSKQPERIVRLCQGIASLADSRSIEVHVYSRARVIEYFSKFGGKTRHDIAMVIAKQVSALERFLPPRRRAWDVESPRMSIFKAAALAMTYFAEVGK
jgi:Holliday junction resolvasome RuvABC endonuclease subunit